MIHFSSSPSHRHRAQVPRPLGAALALVAAIALVLLLVAALGVAMFLGWPRGGAPDPYSQLNEIEPLTLPAKVAAAAGRPDHTYRPVSPAGLSAGSVAASLPVAMRGPAA